MSHEHGRFLRLVLDRMGNEAHYPMVKLQRRNWDEHPLAPSATSRNVLGPASVCRGTVMAVLQHQLNLTDEQIATLAETTVEDVQAAIDKATR